MNNEKTIVYNRKEFPNKNINENKCSNHNNGIENRIEIQNKLHKSIKDGNEMDFDDLLPHAGEFGRYQVFLFFLTMPFYIYGVFVYFTQIFLTEVSPQHWCWIPELANLTDLERRSLAIPPDETGRYVYSRCTSYVANWSEVLRTGEKPNSAWKTAPCQHGWEFNKSEIPYQTISSEYGWVCERDSYQATAQSIFFVGSIVGGFVIGWLADRYGRIPGAVISNLIGCVGGIATIFAKDFVQFSICRFFTGFAYDNCMIMTYILVLEYTAPKYRTLMSNMTFALFFSLGACILPWIALACDDWRTLALATSTPLALAILAPFIVPESPRWLLSKGRIDDAVEKLLVIGRINKKEVPPKLLEQFIQSASQKKEQNEKASKMELFKRPLMRRMFILMCIEYICCAIIFDSLVRSIGLLEFDFFVSFTVVSFTEFPSLMLVAFIMDWLGRRWLAGIFMGISSVFCFATAFIGGGLPAVMCAMVARFSVNIAYNAAIQWSAEILPTGIRASGAAIVHVCGYVATIISPYIVYLETLFTWLPLVVVGCIGALGMVIALLLPETARKEMPQTFDDAEELARTQRFWEMPCLTKKTADKTGEHNETFEP